MWREIRYKGPELAKVLTENEVTSVGRGIYSMQPQKPVFRVAGRPGLLLHSKRLGAEAVCQAQLAISACRKKLKREESDLHFRKPPWFLYAFYEAETFALTLALTASPREAGGMQLFFWENKKILGSERGGLEVKIGIIFLHTEVAKAAMALPPAHCFFLCPLPIWWADWWMHCTVLSNLAFFFFFPQLQVYHFQLISVPCIILDI